MNHLEAILKIVQDRRGANPADLVPSLDELNNACNEYFSTHSDKLVQAVYWTCLGPSGYIDSNEWAGLVFKFMMNELLVLQQEHDYSIEEVTDYKPWLKDDIVNIIFLRYKGILSAKQAKEVLAHCWEGRDVLTVLFQEDILNEAGEDILSQLIDKAFQENPKVLADYKKGRKQSINSLIGPILRELAGKADAALVKTMLERKAELSLQLPN